MILYLPFPIQAVYDSRSILIVPCRSGFKFYIYVLNQT